MTIETLDNVGLRFPECILRAASKVSQMKKGSILEVRASCPSFEKSMRAYCQAVGKEILSVETEGLNTKIVQVQI